MLRFYRYSGAGNSFVTIDGRTSDASRFKKRDVVHALCLQYGTDGLMVLENSKDADFRMDYFNSDGSGGMMCGNGGRCIVAFADLLGVKPFHSKEYTFEASDGIHHAQILSHLGECKIVRLEMKDVHGAETVQLSDATGSPRSGLFLNTGTRHLVIFVQDAEAVDVTAEGRRWRSDPAFAPEGTNVNFVSVDPDGALRVRTFEKGVEAETLACGTGITASALAAYIRGIPPSPAGNALHYTVRAREDNLAVDFLAASPAGPFTSIYLTGPTLCEGSLED